MNTTNQTLYAKNIFALFETAISHRLKYPKIRLQTADGQNIVLKLAGSKSKYNGQVQITDDRPFGSQLRDSINAAYADANKHNEENGQCLRDYAEDISWSDDLAVLLKREVANEKQHRSNRPSVPGFSAETAAKLILMSQVAEGSRLSAMPSATSFLVFRQTAAEARVIGYLIRSFLPAEWYSAVTSLDYSKLMQNGGK